MDDIRLASNELISLGEKRNSVCLEPRASRVSPRQIEVKLNSRSIFLT